MERIYLDNHATTKLDPRVLEVMLPYFTEEYGNTFSKHIYGLKAAEAVELAREQVASLINAAPEEIIFTSGATESNNLVLHNRKRILISAIEHSSIYNTCQQKLLDKTAEVREVDVDRDGIISLERMEILYWVVNPEIISVMLANNEIGTIQPIKYLRQRYPNLLLHTDMAQAAGKIHVDVKDLGVDFASFCAHKLHGPKGIGALYISIQKQNDLRAQMFGGHQEVGYRPGTLNVPAIVGFGKACEICKNEMDVEIERIKELRRLFFNYYVNQFGDVSWNGHDDGLPGNLNITINCKDMDMFHELVFNRVALSSASACEGGQPSRVLKAIGSSEEDAMRSIRLGFGRFNTEEEVIEAAKIICEAINVANEE